VGAARAHECSLYRKPHRKPNAVCANRSIVKLRKIVAGGLYPHRPLVEATPKHSPSCVVGCYKPRSSARTHVVQFDARAFMAVLLGLR